MTKIVAIVHGGSKVPGGVVIATRQTSMVSTMGDYTHADGVIWNLWTEYYSLKFSEMENETK